MPFNNTSTQKDIFVIEKTRFVRQKKEILVNNLCNN